MSNGTATLQHTFATAGSHSITAEFSGAGFVSSSAPAQTITGQRPRPGDHDHADRPQTARTGTEVTLSADVAPNPGSGTVHSRTTGGDRRTGRDLERHRATAATFSSAGQHSITAVFSGAPGFHGLERCRAAGDLSVPDQATTTTLTVPQTAETNQQVTLTANLDPTNASGTVQFKDNGTNIGSA